MCEQVLVRDGQEFIVAASITLHHLDADSAMRHNLNAPEHDTGGTVLAAFSSEFDSGGLTDNAGKQASARTRSRVPA